MTQGYSELARDGYETGADRFPLVNVLMRVDVTGLSIDHRPKRIQLAMDFVRHSIRRVQRNDFVQRCPCLASKNPLSEIDVEPDAQLGTTSTQLNGLVCRFASHHQTRAGHDSALVCVDNPSIYACAETEIIGIYNEQAVPGHANTEAGRYPSQAPEKLRCLLLARAQSS